jgi:hypothetical protein
MDIPALRDQLETILRDTAEALTALQHGEHTLLLRALHRVRSTAADALDTLPDAKPRLSSHA